LLLAAGAGFGFLRGGLDACLVLGTQACFELA